MKSPKNCLNLIIFSLTIFSGLSMISLPILNSPLLANEQPKSRPGRDSGRTANPGIQRGEQCLVGEAQLFKVLIPTIEPNISSQATLYVFIPQLAESKEGQFRVINPNAVTEQVIYDTKLVLPLNTGIVKITIPDHIYLNLEAKEYIWQMMIICDANDRTKDQKVKGKFNFVSLTPEQEKAIQELESQPIEQAKLYDQLGLWSETFAILLSLRDQDQNHEARQELLDFLQSEKLEPFVDSEIINCCQTKEPNDLH